MTNDYLMGNGLSNGTGYGRMMEKLSDMVACLILCLLTKWDDILSQCPLHTKYSALTQVVSEVVHLLEDADGEELPDGGALLARLQVGQLFVYFQLLVYFYLTRSTCSANGDPGSRNCTAPCLSSPPTEESWHTSLEKRKIVCSHRVGLKSGSQVWRTLSTSASMYLPNNSGLHFLAQHCTGHHLMVFPRKLERHSITLMFCSAFTK